MRQYSIKTRVLLILFILICPFTGFAQKPLNDAEIAEVMEICQQIRFDFAQIALKKASTDEVKDFARYILTDYKDETAPVPIFVKDQNQSARDIKKNVALMTTQLKKLKGKNFDQTYLQMQMDLHKRIMKDFEEGLIPAAKNPDLKKALSKVHDEMDNYVDDTMDTYISINK